MRAQDITFKEHILELMGLVVPQTASYATKTVLLTSFTDVPIKISPQQKASSEYLPQTIKTGQANSLLINTRSLLFVQEGNKLADKATVNLLYLLAVCNELSFVFCLPVSTITKPNKKELGEFFANLAKVVDGFGNHKEEFFGSACVALVDDGTGDQLDKYIKDLEAYKKQDSKNPNNSLIQKVILKNKLLFLTQKTQAENLVKQLQKLTCPFKASSMKLRKVYKTLLIPSQLSYIQKQANKYYKEQASFVIENVKEAILNQSIFAEDENDRKQAIEDQISAKMPVQKGFTNEKHHKPVKQFAIQAVIFVLIDLFNVHTKYVKEISAEEYVKFAEENGNHDWQKIPINMSIIGFALEKLFSNKTIFFTESAIQTSKYLHTLLHILQPISTIQIRSFQKNKLPSLLQLIDEIIQFLFSELYVRVDQFSKVPQQPKSIINLTHDIKQLINFLNKYKLIKSNDDKKQIQNKMVYVVCSFFFSAWRSYQLYTGFWNVHQKNKFMFELYDICHVKNTLDMLVKLNKSKMTKIIRKINQYFGDYFASNNQHFLATKFYEMSKFTGKLIESANNLLNSTYQNGTLDFLNISRGLEILSKVGLNQDARKWCYKFMDETDLDPQLILELEKTCDYDRNEGRLFKKYIESLKYEDVSIVDYSELNDLKHNIMVQEWLYRVDNY